MTNAENLKNMSKEVYDMFHKIEPLTPLEVELGFVDIKDNPPPINEEVQLRDFPSPPYNDSIWYFFGKRINESEIQLSGGVFPITEFTHWAKK